MEIPGTLKGQLSIPTNVKTVGEAALINFASRANIDSYDAKFYPENLKEYSESLFTPIPEDVQAKVLGLLSPTVLKDAQLRNVIETAMNQQIDRPEGSEMVAANDRLSHILYAVYFFGEEEGHEYGHRFEALGSYANTFSSHPKDKASLLERFPAREVARLGLLASEIHMVVNSVNNLIPVE